MWVRVCVSVGVWVGVVLCEITLTPPHTHIRTADEGQRVLRAKTLKAKEIALKQQELRAVKIEQQQKRRELRTLIRSEIGAHVNPKLANAKRREKNKYDKIQKKVKAIQDCVTDLSEIEQQLEELRTEVTNSMEDQEVTFMLG